MTEETLYGWQFTIFQGVYHNDSFSHNHETNPQIVAATYEEARQAVVETLSSGEVKHVTSELTITTTPQWIYNFRCLGRAIKVVSWSFIEDEQPG